jgi:membrane protease YdiL (CAAX protease family)
MFKNKTWRAVGIFLLISIFYSWILFFCADAWLEPLFSQRGDAAAARLAVLFGHTLAMLGPALAALFLWRFFHRELPAWKWSRLKYYGWVVLAMLALWTVPGLIVVTPIQTYMWIAIAAELGLGWVSGMGEETGWCAYLLPRLSPGIGRTRALIVSGAIRGLWHWPVLVSPVIVQVAAGERTLAELAGAGIVIAIQLIISNIAFGAVLGWIWYRTESIPLAGWTHFWHNLTRDVTIMLLTGYGTGWWVAQWSALVPLILGFVLIDRVRRSEHLAWWQVFGREPRKASPGKNVPADAVLSGAQIRISRRPAFADKLQTYTVLIDGKEAARIHDDESISVSVLPGDHTVHMKMDWCACGPVAFNVQAGEEIRFACGNHLGGWRIILSPVYLTLLCKRYMWVRREE